MDLLSLALGIALGAVFSPFWLSLWGKIKTALGKNTPPSP